MEKFEINILGCGSALPTLRHYNSSQVINIREKLFMIDCGEGTQIQLRKSRLRFGRLNHIFISHLHGDHCLGLIGLISTFGLLKRTAKLHIYGPAPLASILQPQLDFFCEGMTYEVCIHEIDTNIHECIYKDNSVSIWTLPLAHRMPCCGFLFKEEPVLPHIKKDMINFYHIPHYDIQNIKEGADYILSDGTIVPNNRLVEPSDPARSYAYCSDTLYKPSLSHFIKGIDLLYHEATFLDPDAKRARQTLHSTAADAAKLAKQSQVKKLMIGHFSARYENEQPLLEEAKSIFENTILAEENLCVSI